MKASLKTSLQSLVLDTPEQITDVLLFMAKVCDKKRIESLGTPESTAWSERQLSLEAIVEVLKEEQEDRRKCGEQP